VLLGAAAAGPAAAADAAGISGTWRFVDAKCTRAVAKKFDCKIGDESYFQVVLRRSEERLCGVHESILGLESARHVDAPKKGQISVWGRCIDVACNNAGIIFDSKFSESPAGEGTFVLQGDRLVWQTVMSTGVGNWPIKAVLARVPDSRATVPQCPKKPPAWATQPKQYTTTFR
jgi:hypothetical protein